MKTRKRTKRTTTPARTRVTLTEDPKTGNIAVYDNGKREQINIIPSEGISADVTWEKAEEFARYYHFEVEERIALVPIKGSELAEINRVMSTCPGLSMALYTACEEPIAGEHLQRIRETFKRYAEDMKRHFEYHAAMEKELHELRAQRRAIGAFIKAAIEDNQPTEETK